MTILKLETPRVFAPLLAPSRYKGAHGGRGSGKSHFFAERVVVESIAQRGLRTVCIRESLRSLKESSKLLIEDKIQSLGVGSYFRVLNDRIETPGDGLIIFQGMQDHTAESIKSLEGFSRAWLEEAQAISERSLSLLRPTIRRNGSEIWASWNPRRKTDAIDKFLRQEKPAGAVVIEANWRDNPWFPDVLRAEREIDLQLHADRYEHIWEGGYARAFEGAYFAKELAACRVQGRIGHLGADHLLPIRAIFDLGGSGASADAMAIWICQWVAREIRILAYFEGVGQTLGYYINELRAKGYPPEQLDAIIPHDGVNENNITGKRYQDHLSEAGFRNVEVVKNQGKGAAMMRVEATRRLFPQIWFNESTTEAGRDALGYYHERKDENRDVGLGPEHDWSSHAADAFGLMCVAYEQPRGQKKWAQPSAKWVV